MELINPHIGGDQPPTDLNIPLDRLDEKWLLPALWRLFDASKSARKQFEGPWEEYRRFWRGDQRVGREKPQFIYNHIYKITEQVVGTMSEEDFKITVLPTESDDEEIARILTLAADWTVQRMNMLENARGWVRDAYVDGTGVVKTYWQPDLHKGKGNTAMRSIDLERLYFDNESTSIHPAENDASWMAHETFVTTAYIKRKWGDEVDADEDLSDKQYGRSTFVTANRVTPHGTAFQPRIEGAPKAVVTRRARLAEFWVRDHVLVDYGLAIPEKQRRKAKSPQWLIVNATRKKIHAIRKSPYIDLPFTPFIPTRVKNQLYGLSEIQHLMDPQRDYNLRRDQLSRHAAFHAQPMMMVDPRARYNHQNIVVGPGKVYPLLGQATFMQSPPIDQAAVDSATISLRDMEDISAVHDVSRGQRAPNVSAGVAIEALQAKAATRTNARSKILEKRLQNVAEHVVHNLVKFWTMPRTLRMLGESETSEFREIDLPGLLRQMEDTLEFDVQVKLGGSRAARELEEQQAIILHQQQAIDRTALLDSLQFPNRERIVARMEVKEQEQQQMMLAAQQGAAGGAPGGAPAPAPPGDVGAIVGAPDVASLPPELQGVMQWAVENFGEDVTNQQILPALQQEIAEAAATEEA
jgi:hypothetical protein